MLDIHTIIGSVLGIILIFCIPIFIYGLFFIVGMIKRSKITMMIFIVSLYIGIAFIF